jgi:hypothetical protein
MPPVLAVVTHIDLLSPAMEWAPPYDWVHPQRPKENAIREAMSAAHDQLGDRVAGIVPACGAKGRVYGIDEAVLPAILDRLGDARGVALLRCLRDEADAGKVRRVFDQLAALGKEAAKAMWRATAQPT